jgi:hypothetical protein
VSDFATSRPTTGLFPRPLSYPDIGRLVYVSQAYPGFPEGGGQFSYPTYLDVLRQNNSFDALAAYQISGPLLLGVATFACWIPVRRAMRFDPMEPFGKTDSLRNWTRALDHFRSLVVWAEVAEERQ